MEIGVQNNEEEPKDNDLNFSKKIKNDNFFSNIQLSKTEIIDNIQSSRNIENQKDIFDSNPTMKSINEFTDSKKIFPEELTETQVITPNMQPETNNVINSSGNITKNQTQLGANFTLGNPELNKASLNYVENNSFPNHTSIETPQFVGSNHIVSGVQIPLQSQSTITSEKTPLNYLPSINQGGNYINIKNLGDNITQLSYYQSQPGIREFPFIESQSIYEKENIKQSGFVESQNIYKNNPEQIVKYKIKKSEDNNLNDKAESISYPHLQNINTNEKKQEIFITDNEIKNVENQFKTLKVSKTKYLSEEELANLMNHNDIPEDNINKNEKDKNEFAYIPNPIDQNENIYSTNNANTNMAETNIITGKENNTNINILGNDEIIKNSKIEYVKDDFNGSDNFEDIQEPLQDKKINNSKVLKIEDEENIHFCPDFITKFFKKLFG